MDAKDIKIKELESKIESMAKVIETFEWHGNDDGTRCIDCGVRIGYEHDASCIVWNALRNT